MTKVRLDSLLIEQKFFESKQKAQAAIMSKIVKVNDKIVDKAGTMIKPDSIITLTQELESKYVSRGGFKLEKAIQEFNCDVKDKIFLDIGASTGGFTDCLLKNGAKFVYSIDVGYGQIDWAIRQNEHVKVIERCNARYLKPEELYINQEEKADGAVIDVSFISLEKIIPNLITLLKDNFFIMSLVKPQFEAGKENLKKGVVISPNIHEQVLKNFADFLQSININLIDISYSPIKGPSGNIEFLAYINSNSFDPKIFDKIPEIVKKAHTNLKSD
jgi:23S rRNA (cytidine1920-2'-O)/16S rRNA (cytidine1409-2'-O)-methyltransferase